MKIRHDFATLNLLKKVVERAEQRQDRRDCSPWEALLHAVAEEESDIRKFDAQQAAKGISYDENGTRIEKPKTKPAPKPRTDLI